MNAVTRTLAALASLSLLAACTKLGSSAAGSGQHPYTHAHELRYADLGDPSSLNPMLSSDLVSSWLADLTMGYLFRTDAKNQFIPELATEVPSPANGGIGRDGLSITYHLRKNVKWSDGAPFDADDVVFTTHLVLDPKTLVVSRDGWDRIVKIDEPDKYTVVYHLKAPYSPAIGTFFATGSSGPALLPKHLLAHTTDINRDPYNQLPVGIGPFAVTKWARGDRVEMVANANYWRGRPKLDKIVYRIIPNRDTLLSLLQTGDIDLWPGAAPAYLPRAAALPNVHIDRHAGYSFGHFDLNMVHPVLADVVVRRALELSFDRRTQRQKIGHGVGILQDAIVSPASPFADKRLGFTEFDPAKANAMLDAAGWKRGADGVRAKNGVRLAIEVVSNSGSPDTDQRIELARSNWQQIGVSLVRKNVSPTLLFAPPSEGGILYTGKFDVLFYATYPDATGSLRSAYSCDQFIPNGQNDVKYCDKATQAALDDYLKTYSFERQKRDNDVVQERIATIVPTIVTAVQEDLFVYNDDLKNFKPNEVAFFDDMMNVDI